MVAAPAHYVVPGVKSLKLLRAPNPPRRAITLADEAGAVRPCAQSGAPQLFNDFASVCTMLAAVNPALSEA